MGRPYTMQEMKQIVEYLIEHRAYGEIRGRKMWVGMANAGVIDRTWQSLKETFNKRILPDIHNPYYKLNVEQISSFRQMADVTEKTKNKLVIRDASDDSSASDNHRPKEQASKIELEKSGEGKCSKIQNRTRSSTETLVLDNCSECASDSQKDVEPSDGQKTKSLRDLITYSEPLTPMLQEVIDDFTSDDEPPLQIVEDPESGIEPPAQNEENNQSNFPKTILESDSHSKKTEATINADDGNKTQSSKIKSLKLKKTQKGTWENKEPVTSPVKEKETNNNESEITTPSDKNSTIDTQLPNNQEGLALLSQPARVSTESSTSEFVETRKKKKEKRNRSRSQSSVERKKKKKDKHRHSDEMQDQSKDTQTFDSHPQAANLTKNLAIEFANNAVDQTNNTSDDTNIPPNVTAEKTNEGTSQEAGPSGFNNLKNPCLKPASLFVEQPSQSKYLDSENGELSKTDNALAKDDIEAEKSNIDQEKTNVIHEESDDNHERSEKSAEKDMDTSEAKNSYNNIPTPSKKQTEDVVLLKSHSESDSEDFEPPKRTSTQIEKKRERALANVFGFSCGAVAKRNNFKCGRTNTNRYRNHRRSRNISNTIVLSESGSSKEYTTASDSEDSYHNKSRGGGFQAVSHKYKKPKALDIAENPTSGDLYVLGHKKIYPLMLKHGDSVHYAKLRNDYNKFSADEPSNESYWKKKFLEEQKKLAEEKIRADELARLLRNANERQKQAEAEPGSPILQNNVTLSTATAAQKQGKPPAAEGREYKPEEMVKIKFTKNKEIELEGQWAHVTPVLEKMVAIFNNVETHAENNKNIEKESVSEPEKTTVMETNKQEAIQNNEQDKQVNPQSPTKADTVQQSSKNLGVTDENTNKNTNVKQKLNIKGKTIQRRVSAGSRRKISSETVISSNKSDEAEVISSGKSTPVVSQADPEIREKVDKIESEIFKTIEDIDKSDQNFNQNEDVSDHITTRKRGRPKKVSSSLSSNSAESLSKTARKRTVSESARTEAEKNEMPTEGDIVLKSVRSDDVLKSVRSDDVLKSVRSDDVLKSVRSDDVLKSVRSDDVLKSVRSDDVLKSVRSDDVLKSVRSDDVPKSVGSDDVLKLLEEDIVEKVVKRSKRKRTSLEESDSNVKRNTRAPRRYGSDSGVTPKRKPRSRSKLSLRSNEQDLDDDTTRYMLPPKGRKPARIYTHQLNIPPLDSPRLSESTQGYQESNPSPLKVTIRKKRKLGTVGLLNKRQISNVRRKSSPYLADDSCSTNEEPSQKPGGSSTLNSEVYKSESYQLLMPKAREVAQMDTIDESPAQNAADDTHKHFDNFSALTVEVNNELYIPPNEPRNELLLRTSEGSSSNFSLPLSPELSVVEKLTVSREIISSSFEHPSINEIQANGCTQPTDCNKYFISEVDVSMPLMQQDCDFHTNKLRDRRRSASVTLGERMSVNTVEPTDDSLEKKLRDLLLESAKKIAEGNMIQLFQDNMEVENATAKKSVSRRQSSTPRKRTVRQLKTPNIDPVLEEHTESCSRSGRKSCPPMIYITPCETDTMNNNNNVIKDKQPKGRKKKDVIKVKITSRRKSSSDKLSKRVSVCTDSGINDTNSIASESKLSSNDSSALIHNHSDTCLHIDDCLGDSVVFIENENSIISLTSSLPTESNSQESKRSTEQFVTPESFCTNAQDATKFDDASQPTSAQSTDGDAATVYHTPPDNASIDSLMTDDLSDDPPPPQSTKWYLFSEDDTNSLNKNPYSVGSNLNQIFPLTCAVPDLSTITEMSKENETKNTVMSPDSQMAAFSQSILEFEM